MIIRYYFVCGFSGTYQKCVRMYKKQQSSVAGQTSWLLWATGEQLDPNILVWCSKIGGNYITVSDPLYGLFKLSFTRWKPICSRRKILYEWKSNFILLLKIGFNTIIFSNVTLWNLLVIKHNIWDMEFNCLFYPNWAQIPASVVLHLLTGTYSKSPPIFLFLLHVLGNRRERRKAVKTTIKILKSIRIL